MTKTNLKSLYFPTQTLEEPEEPVTIKSLLECYAQIEKILIPMVDVDMEIKGKRSWRKYNSPIWAMSVNCDYDGLCKEKETCNSDCGSDCSSSTKPKVFKCKESNCLGILEYVNGAFRCKDCWKTFFVHEID